MIEIQHILVPTDFSEPALEATRYALELARRFDATLHVLHVVQEPFFYSPGIGGYAPNRDEFEAYAETALQSWISAEDAEGLRIERTHVFGTPFVQIIESAKQHSADLIVIGTHGRSMIPHLLMGSVAENVVRKAPCPVLTVRPSTHSFVMP